MRRSNDVMWERWDEIDRILDQALELPEPERAVFVRGATSKDAELGDLVLRLVGRVHTGGQARVAGPDAAVVAAAFGVTPEQDESLFDLVPGTEIGRYIVLRRRARGGMATVYEAERGDGAYQQRVAIKVLRRGLDTEDLIRRFRTERQILSSLTHPNIARLLDGGATGEGRPFLVMELVEGTAITRWADDHSLNLRARLDLFLGVAEAVHAAHQHLVVHRDIKPSNIMVDPSGRVKLLDFGIAKLLDRGEEQTEGGLRALTPDYASPEQLRGEAITTATDVYQLGLLLRELLTGVRPLAGDTQPGQAPLLPSRVAARDLPRAESPEARAASRSTTPGRLVKELRGDLDVIVGKALREVPAERYASADELGADVRRYLKGLPILAHPESAVYRATKFARRNRWSVAATALAALFLAAYAVTATVQGRQIAAASALAREEARTAEQVTDFLVRLFQSGNPTVALSDTVTVLGILEEGARRIDTALAREPEVRARMLLAIGTAFTGLGRFERADSMLTVALSLQRRLHGDDHTRAADVLNAIGANHSLSRDFRAADQAHHEEFRIRTAGGLVSDTSRARMFERMSLTRRELDDPDSALGLIRQAVALRRSAGDTASAAYLGALGRLALVLRAAGALDSAEAIYREVLDRTTAREGPDGLGLAALHNNLGFLLRTRGDHAGAVAEYREAVRIAHQMLGAGHPTSLMLSANMAGALDLLGKDDEVEAILRGRIAAAERAWPGGWRVGSAQSSYGVFLVRRGRYAEALGPLAAAVDSYRKALGEDHPWTAMERAWYGVALFLTGRPADGDRWLLASRTVLRSQRSDLDGDTRFNLGRAADLLQSLGHQARAESLREILAPVDSAGGKR
jgi:serine/threonine-protein kinase